MALETEFEKSSDWSKERIQEVANQLDQPRIRIYKWVYDRQKKAKATTTDRRADKKKVIDTC